jgi:hypothetical protein
MDVIQPSLFEDTIQQRFEAFHAEHPEVYVLLSKLARDYLNRTGKQRVGIKMLWERLRWEWDLQTGETPRLDNRHVSRYARLLMAREPDLQEAFETRRLKAS